MPDSARTPGTIRIDRLILEVPGIGAAEAAGIARELSRTIAQLGLEGVQRDQVVLEYDGGDPLVRLTALLRTEFSR